MITNPVQTVSSPESSTLYVVAGFEDRCLAYLRKCCETKVNYSRIVAIAYRPEQPANRLGEILELARNVSPDVRTVTFNRFDPAEAIDLEPSELSRVCATTTGCVLDISGMSRFLIVILVARLARLGLLSHIVYTQPLIYHPTRAEFDSQAANTEEYQRLIFLTTGLFGITAVPDLTTSTMQGYPEALVASPDFEPRFMRALLNEFSPAELVILEGIPPNPENHWRREAVRQLNRFAFETATVFEHSTFSIDESVSALYRIYKCYKYTHRLVVVPAASKLAAVGIGLAIANGLQCEIVYPTPLGFSNPYSEGTGEQSIWAISLNSAAKAALSAH